MTARPPLRLAALALHLAACAPLWGAAGAASAQSLSPAPRPGLWQTDWKVMANGQDIGALMARATADMIRQLPADQRAQAEAALKGQPMPGQSERECVTAAESARVVDPRHVLAELRRDAPQCRFDLTSASGSTLRFQGQCDDPDGFSGPVAGEFTLTSAQAWTAHYGGKGRMAGLDDIPGFKAPADGRVDFQMQGGGRWLAADCGGVAPPTR